MPTSVQNDVKYIYQLPYHERKVLCAILDQRDIWEELGGEHMKLDVLTLQTLRRETLCGRSPTDALLWHWSQQNHTVVELFVLLSRMQHYQAMLVLKPFVDEQYHRLIYEGEENLGVLGASRNSRQQDTPHPGMGSSGVSEARGLSRSADKNLRIDSRNINVSAVRADLPSKDVLPAVPERKILNTQQQQQQQQRGNTDVQPPRRGSTGSDASSRVESCSAIPQVAYAELERATGGWSRDAILGRGGFGTVYKGIWKNTPVAVKRLEQREAAADSREQDELLLRELSFPNSCRHDNVLPIYGVSLGGPAPCLVYQFMPNGSVEDRLLCRGRTPPLTWVQRLKIAEGTALGLQFLHTRPTPVIHGDIKSANILLGAEFEPRIADFGLAREGPRSDYTHVMVSRVHGTRPYLPEEFLRSRQFSVKVDTYSFGVVLFELCTGLRAYQQDRPNKYLKEHVEGWSEAQLPQLLDRRAPDDDHGVFLGLVMLGKCCVARQPRRRPDMVGVLRAVRELVSATEPLRLQHQLMQQSRAASSMAALHDYVTQQRRGSSPQSLPGFLHPPLMEQALVFPAGYALNQVSPGAGAVAPLPVHREEDEAGPRESSPPASSSPHALHSEGRADGAVFPRFSKLLSLKQDSDDPRSSVDSCTPDGTPAAKTVDLG
ncbi:serine/threonine-protein kinase pelle-like isoform X2 [Bacillus rossius redtenbacheri]|uniref:serine/threonine-protein kinase pelle-like isoform X2 n=1 Tax=Bacillus rossius redtenbacheri TaxID=93214 RepID=UPI002FDD0083